MKNERTVRTLVGPVVLERRYWICPNRCEASQGYLVDETLGVKDGITRRLQERICKLSSDVSFAKAAEHLADWLPQALCAETIRQCHQRHGRAIQRWQAEESTTPAAFQSARGEIELTIDAGKVHTRENGWKDVKIAAFAKRPLGPSATADDWCQRELPQPTIGFAWATIDCARVFRQSWRDMATRLGIQETSRIQAMADGASWIWKSFSAVLGGCRQLLDIYHASEHVADAGKQILGEGTAEANDFLERGRKALLEKGWLGLQEFFAFEQPRAQTLGRSRELEKMLAYFAPNLNRIDYPKALAEGRPIGSGMIEGWAKTLGLRLKARGARWCQKNAIGTANLICVRHSTQWANYWAAA